MNTSCIFSGFSTLINCRKNWDRTLLPVEWSWQMNGLLAVAWTWALVFGSEDEDTLREERELAALDCLVAGGL